jgi:hypothetical protein
MQDDNPYKPPASPVSPTDAPSSATDPPDAFLVKKAREILPFKDFEGASFWRAFLDFGLLLRGAGCLSIALAVWLIGLDYGAVAIVGFFLGSSIRDVWIISTSLKEWKAMRILIDWEKVQTIARQSPFQGDASTPDYP